MELCNLYKLFLSCTEVTTDSRNCPQGSMFIALKGETFNGNSFADKALEKGCAYAVIDEEKYIQPQDERYILVDNCLQTLQQLARLHRQTLGTPLIGITGTNGKTTTKELIAAVLSCKYNLLYTQGNFNNSIGVPLTLLRLKPAHELGVIEMGASHPGDIKELVEMVEPNYGIITNVGKAHLLGFGSFEGVIHTKGELYDYLRQQGNATIFIHQDNEYLKKMANGLKQITYGTKEAHVIGKVTENSPYLSFEWSVPTDSSVVHTVKTQLIGAYNFTNALAAVTIGRYFNVKEKDINEAIGNYTPQNNRSQLQQTADNTLIIDAYNANPTSMHASIENFYRMQADDKWLILGDMKELGAESANEHQVLVNYLEECQFKNVILVGDQFAATVNHYTTFKDAAALIEELKKEKPVGKTILIKGSNSIKLSSITAYL